ALPIALGRGTKVDQVLRLQRHLSFVYGSEVRIAYIYGKRAVGIEVPNGGRTIPLKDVISSDKFSIALGASIDGPVQVSLDSLPHLLVAGATGSGKSVFVNSLICELIKKNTPDELRLVLIDPKRVELQQYAGLPHLWGEVVTDPLDADNALKHVVFEMERRYRQMEEAQVRNAKDLGLSKIVVIIDEYADLRMVVGKSVGDKVVRIAQLARAAGIHLIVATQRTSVDVITGLIKSNFPARLSFRTSSAIDSRVILDSKGAEVLTGRGDGLYRSNGALTRLRAPYVSDAEIDRLVRHWS